MQTTISSLYNAAFGLSNGKNNTSARLRTKTWSLAWFLIVACLLSITLRALDQWLFNDEDVGTSELCAFCAFIIGAGVSLWHRSGNVPSAGKHPRQLGGSCKLAGVLEADVNQKGQSRVSSRSSKSDGTRTDLPVQRAWSQTNDVLTVAMHSQGALTMQDHNLLQNWLLTLNERSVPEACQAFSALIKARAHCGGIHEAEEWMSQGLQLGLTASTQSHNALIHVCVKEGDVERAEKWLKFMIAAPEQRCLPDVVSYSAVIDAHAQNGRVEQAEALFQCMIDAGIRPDAVSFNTVIKAHARSGGVAGAERWAQHARKFGVSMDSFGYNAIIAAAARANEPHLAEQWLNRMIKEGARPDVISYNSVINGWAKRGAANVAERLVKQMFLRRCEPDVVTLAAAAHACAKSGDCKRAEAIFDAIVSRGNVRPDVICYNALIDVYVKAGNTRGAEAWLSEMIAGGIAPSVVTYTTVIHAHAQNGNIDAAESALVRMLEAGVEANVVSYSALIGACAKAGDVDRAEHWFDRMRLAGIRGNNISYSVLLNVCAKAGDYQRAERWLEAMCADGVAPNVVCFNNIIDACSKAGLPERAESWLRLLSTSPTVPVTGGITVEHSAQAVKPTRQSFTTAAQAYAARGGWSDVERIMAEMEHRGITMDEFCLTMLLSAYSRGRPRQRERGEHAFRRHALAGLPITKPPLRVLRSLIGTSRLDCICAELRVPTGAQGADTRH